MLPPDRKTPHRVAVVGAGPAGLYAADRLLRDPEHAFEVHLLDRLPTPWGLVRAGVAPDHPKIKSVTRVYEKTAALDGFHFHGNVEVGTDVTHDELAECFHAVVHAYGAARDRRLGIPGEDLHGSVAATQFVAWYNGHPDAADQAFDLRGPRVVVVGNGNVALDVARMLVLAEEELAPTDTADHALDALRASGVREVVVLGRRGPAQAAYTTPELRELGQLAAADVVVDPVDAQLDQASREWLASDDADPTARRNVSLVQEYAARNGAEAKARRIVLRYRTSPVEILGTDRVEGVRVVRNALVAGEDGRVRAVPTGEHDVIPCSLVLRSVGYLGAGLDGLPFDERSGTIVHDRGRILDAPGGAPRPGAYAAGWIKRGPSGVIGTNKRCAHETVEALVEDLEAGRLPEPPHRAERFEALLAERGVRRVDHTGWTRIDEHERARGVEQGRPRVKLTRRDHLLEQGLGAGRA